MRGEANISRFVDNGLTILLLAAYYNREPLNQFMNWHLAAEKDRLCLEKLGNSLLLP